MTPAQNPGPYLPSPPDHCWVGSGRPAAEMYLPSSASVYTGDGPVMSGGPPTLFAYRPAATPRSGNISSGVNPPLPDRQRLFEILPATFATRSECSPLVDNSLPLEKVVLAAGKGDNDNQGGTIMLLSTPLRSRGEWPSQIVY
ncbi:hypothetical protein BaRGS_00017310 [Batillaria attramentaria]|uniref:Uncharacterized protein n=1 Tax=Batillaria attramentaria TaxID=370345 RepID=A0ABD0KWS5_9CAEN